MWGGVGRGEAKANGEQIVQSCRATASCWSRVTLNCDQMCFKFMRIKFVTSVWIVNGWMLYPDPTRQPCMPHACSIHRNHHQHHHRPVKMLIAQMLERINIYESLVCQANAESDSQWFESLNNSTKKNKYLHFCIRSLHSCVFLRTQCTSQCNATLEHYTNGE